MTPRAAEVGPPSPAAPTNEACSPLVELRRYTLYPGQREALIQLFDREFVEPQEALGIDLIGQFRDLDRDDHFVWLRGFPDMESRLQALTVFYTGPVWKEHRDAANATMIDSDDVLLLRPARPGSGFSAATLERPPVGSPETAAGLVVATTYHLGMPADPELIAFFSEIVTPEAARHGVQVAASFVTEQRPNNYPRLPVREGEQVLVWFATYRDRAESEECMAELERSERWRDSVAKDLVRWVQSQEVARLAPTDRSRLRGPQEPNLRNFGTART